MINGNQFSAPVNISILDFCLLIRVDSSIWEGPDFDIRFEEDLFYRLLTTASSPHIEVKLTGEKLGTVDTLRGYLANDYGRYAKPIIETTIIINALDNAMRLRLFGKSGLMDFDTIKHPLELSIYDPKPTTFDFAFEWSIKDIDDFFHSKLHAEAARAFIYRFTKA